MTLDEKLKEILVERAVDLIEDFEHPLDLNPTIAQIKQAFADEGHKPSYMIPPVITGGEYEPELLPPRKYSSAQLQAIQEELNKPRMTGGEWYKRFTKELRNYFYEFDDDSWPTHLDGYGIEVFLDVALKASGLSREES